MPVSASIDYISIQVLLIRCSVMTLQFVKALLIDITVKKSSLDSLCCIQTTSFVTE